MDSIPKVRSINATSSQRRMKHPLVLRSPLCQTAAVVVTSISLGRGMENQLDTTTALLLQYELESAVDGKRSLWGRIRNRICDTIRKTFSCIFPCVRQPKKPATIFPQYANSNSDSPPKCMRERFSLSKLIRRYFKKSDASSDTEQLFQKSEGNTPPKVAQEELVVFSKRIIGNIVKRGISSSPNSYASSEENDATAVWLKLLVHGPEAVTLIKLFNGWFPYFKLSCRDGDARYDFNAVHLLNLFLATVVNRPALFHSRACYILEVIRVQNPVAFHEALQLPGNKCIMPVDFARTVFQPLSKDERVKKVLKMMEESTAATEIVLANEIIEA